MDRMRQNHVAEVQKAAEAAKAKEHETIKALEAAKVAAVQEAVAVTRRDVEAECHRYGGSEGMRRAATYSWSWKAWRGIDNVNEQT